MGYFLARLLIAALGLWIASALVPGMEIEGMGTLLAAALLLGLVNALVRPVLIFLTLPLTIFTLGLFLLVINAAMLGLVAWLLPNFLLEGFFSALFGSIVVTIVSWCASRYVGRTRD
ncbi:phage holin family protein [Candidatus Zixiibacteriota bacterium]